jgi:hypothetical protein
MQKWEYIRLTQSNINENKTWSWEDGSILSQEERLKEMGEEEWELVSVVALAGVDGTIFHLYFKRPLQE